MLRLTDRHRRISLVSAGFTVPELVVTVSLLLIFVLGSTFFLRTIQPVGVEQAAERRLALASIMQGIDRYYQANGSLPPDIPTRLTTIGRIEEIGSAYDLCTWLVPKYLDDIPIESQAGAKLAGDDDTETTQSCNTPGVAYLSGYMIMREGQTISLTPLVQADEPLFMARAFNDQDAE